MRTPFLIQSVDGKVVTKTLCTSHTHANNIWRDLLLRMDPFHHYGSLTVAIGRPIGNGNF